MLVWCSVVAGKKVEFWAPNLGTKKPSDFSTIRMGLHSLAWDGLMIGLCYLNLMSASVLCSRKLRAIASMNGSK